MTLKEMVAKTKPMITKEEMDAYDGSKEDKQYDAFLNICERLENELYKDGTNCRTYEEIFSEVEKRKIDISDIVSESEYNELKETMINDDVQWCPIIGKRDESETTAEIIEKAYEEFTKKNGRSSF